MSFKFPIYLLLGTMTILLLGCQTEVVPEIVEKEVEVEVTRIEVLEVPMIATQIKEVTRIVTVESPVLLEVEVTPDHTPVPTVPAVDPNLLPGSPERPIQLIFLPDSAARLVEVRGGFLVEALTARTGYTFELVTPETEAEGIDLLCSRPQEAFALLTPDQYVEAKSRCNVALGLVATRFDSPFSLGMLVAKQDRVINVIEDLAYKRVGILGDGDIRSRLFIDTVQDISLLGVEYVEYESESSALIALLNDEIDVSVASYNPPMMPNEAIWRYGIDSPEIWRQLEVEPLRDPIGFVEVAGGPEFGGFRIRDARSVIFDDYPEIFELTKIVTLSDPIPNEAIVVSSAFPYQAAGEIFAEFEIFVNSSECDQSLCASDFYHWTGAEPASDTVFNVLRELDPIDTAEAADGS